MKISTKGRYAIRVMLDLAQQDPKAYTSVASIAQRQEISVKYLEMIISILNKGGYLRSQMGKKGGYQLSKSAQDYTVGEILRLTEGSLAPVSCLECEEEVCSRAKTCLTLPMWKELDRRIGEYLDSVTLADLLKN